MEITSFAFHLRVNNLELCRNFYRELLEPAAPVIDSNFLVEFNVGENVKLILALSNADFLEHASSAGGFMFSVDDPEAVINKLTKSGYELHAKNIFSQGRTMIRCLDPENNPFYLTR
jgi:predicted enzyme related to lactoylglutathione lyase